MIYGDDLQHHGVIGQKWGVIRTKALRAIRRAKEKLKRKKVETNKDKTPKGKSLKDKTPNYKNGQYRNKNSRELSPTEKLRLQNDLKDLIDNVNVSRGSAREAKRVYRNREDLDQVKSAIKKLREEADYNYELKRTNASNRALAKVVGKVAVNTALKSQGLRSLSNISDAAFKASDNTSRAQRRNAMIKAILEASANKYLDSIPREVKSGVTKEFKKAAEPYKKAMDKEKVKNAASAYQKTMGKEKSKVRDTVEKEFVRRAAKEQKIKGKTISVKDLRNEKPITTDLAIYKKKKRR